MVLQHHTQRRKLYNAFVEGATPTHGHVVEYFLVVFNIMLSAAFVFGSVCFFYEEWLGVGSYTFVFGSFSVFLMQVHAMWEERNSKDHSDPIVDREKSTEFQEHMAFAISGLLFAVGSIFYIPGIGGTDDPNVEYLDQSYGSWIFLCGSFGFAVASYCNACAMADNKDETKMTDVYLLCHKLHVTGLLCSQLGSMFFFSGSFLYRPGLANHCEDETGVAAKWCTSSADTGTWLYVIGSILFFIESILSFACSALKHKYGDKQLKIKQALLEDVRDVPISA